MVDTAAAEFPAQSPYYLSLARRERRDAPAPAKRRWSSSAAARFASGRGSSSTTRRVHAAWALREAGRAAVVINNNPETVSTDFDVSDVLMFEPPGADEVEAASCAPNARGVMLAFGGQTAINLAGQLAARGIAIVGSDRRSLDIAEDREKFERSARAAGRRAPARPGGAQLPRGARDRARDRLPGARAALVRAGRARRWRSSTTRASSRATSSRRRRSRPARRC